MDETWLYHYDLQTKQQSMEWRHSGSPRLKNFSLYANELPNCSKWHGYVIRCSRIKLQKENIKMLN